MRRYWGYSAAALAVASAALLFARLSSESIRLLYFALPVLGASWFGGGPALLATALSLVVAVYLLPSRFGIRINDIEDWYRLAAFCALGIAMAIIGEARKRFADKLVQSESRVQAILASIAQGYVCLDRDWRIVEMNRAAEDYAGTTLEQVVGRIVWEAFPGTAGSTFESRLRDAVERNQSSSFEVKSSRSGRWFEIHAFPEVESLSVYFRDITRRKSLEEERERLLEEHANFRRILESLLQHVPAGLMISEVPANKVLMVSEYGSKILGVPREAIIGMTVREIAAAVRARREEDKPAAAEAELTLMRAARGEMVIDEEWLVESPDGEKKWIRASASSLRDSGGRIVGAVSTWRDITGEKQARAQIEKLYESARQEIDKRRELEERLRRSNEDLQQFASVISHDLREPVRSSSGFAALLKKRYSVVLPPAGNELLDMTLDGLERIRQMIEGLLNYSRIGREEEKLEEVDLEAPLTWARNSLARAIREHGASIHSDPMPKVRGHFGRFAQLFQNLLGNAIKYRRPGVPPEIRVQVEPLADRWKIVVADNGIGIDPAGARHIFEPFRRLHGAEFPGAGMGLAICKRIVEHYGGEIWVEPSEAGSRFCFTLPAKV